MGDTENNATTTTTPSSSTPSEEQLNPLAPAASERIIWKEELAVPKPFLIPDDENEGEIIEALPPEKENRKIMWSDDVELCEMPNRKQLGLTDDSEMADDDDYEIEIVEDDGDADFYLEIVDGEIFYVFETEGDSDSDDSDDDMEDYSDNDSGSAKPPVQLPIESMMAPRLGFDDDDEDEDGMAGGGGGAVSAADDTAQAVSSGMALVSDDDEDGFQPALPTEIQLSQSEADNDDDQDEDMEMDLSDLMGVAGRPNLLTTDSSQDEISHSDRMSDKLQDSFHESFHASGGSLLIGSPVESPESVQKESVSAPSTPTSNKSPANKVAPYSPGKSPGSILKACPPSPRRKKTPKEKKKNKGVTKTYVRADTFDGEHQVYTWEKPEWAGENNANKLKETGKGDDVRKGANLAGPITFPKQKKSDAAEQKSDVYEDAHGNVIDKEELIRRIQEGDTNVMAFVPLPTYGGRHQPKLKFSVQGQKMRSGMDLAKPITKATVDRKRDDINLVARPEDHLKKHVEVVKKEYGWQKPEWAKAAKLKSTSNGAAIKTGSKVEAPVTNIREIKKEYTWEKPDWTKKRLSSTSAGNALKSGVDLQRPITKREPGRGVVKAHSSEELSPRRPVGEGRSVARSRSFELSPDLATTGDDNNEGQ